MASAFFYGTLMHPKILKRVVGHQGSYLRITPALLFEYTRHKVKYADYPAIVCYSESRTVFDRDLDAEERCVRGSLVTGLSEEDIRLLDIFEGDEYIQVPVPVYPLGPPMELDELEAAGVVPNEVPVIPCELPSAVEVYTYVWCKPLSDLEAKLWTLDEFVRDSSWKWIGIGSVGLPDYDEVDKRRKMDGHIVRGTEAQN